VRGEVAHTSRIDPSAQAQTEPDRYPTAAATSGISTQYATQMHTFLEPAGQS
jgi:hypothetical protein